MPEPLKNYDEAAAWLGISARWLENGVQAGRLPHTRFGKCVRFSQEHLDAIVKLHEPKSVQLESGQAASAEPSGAGATATATVAAPTAKATAERQRAGVIGRRRSS